MTRFPKTLLLALVALALYGGGALAVDPADPEAEPAAAHHGGGDGRHGDGMRAGMTMACMAPPAATGDADQDFALRMRHHHQAGVRMAQAEIAAGNDAAMQAMAEGIVEVQTREIAALDAWLAGEGVNPEEHTMLRRHFAMMDKDADGAITHVELTDAEPMHRHFAEADKDADGRVTLAEAEAMHAAMCDGSMAPMMMTGAPHPPAAGNDHH